MTEIIKLSKAFLPHHPGILKFVNIIQKEKLSKYRLSDKLTSSMNQDKLAEFYESKKQKKSYL